MCHHTRQEAGVVARVTRFLLCGGYLALMITTLVSSDQNGGGGGRSLYSGGENKG